MTKSKHLLFVILLYLVIGEAHKIAGNFQTLSPSNSSSRKPAIFEEVKTTIKYTHQDFECLARNIFFEAGTEETLGKLAVAQVTLNRLQTGYWGDHICDVVYSPEQFSWTKDHQLSIENLKGEHWNDSVLAAKIILENGIRIRQLKHALFYHAEYVNPSWSDVTSRIGVIGRHIYYERAKGSWLEL